LNKLKSSTESRIIFLTCTGYLRGDINFDDLNSMKDYDEEKAYNQSKLANVLCVTELKKRLKDSNVTVNCVNPGYVKTDLLKNSSAHNSFDPIIFFFTLFLKTPVIGSQSVIFASVSESLNNVSGKIIKYLISRFKVL
jgi:NAD(P)-dependent dehydrogenase (short-subunit alcohol dehydrogenase family)